MAQEVKSLEQRIMEQISEDEELIPDEYSNLILDDQQIKELTEEDQKFLDKFINLVKLSLNCTKLKNLDYLPKKDLVRIELSDNQISGDELDKLLIYKNSLTILKICNNKINTMEQLKKLKDLDKLIKLDLSGNEVCNVEEYRTKVFDEFQNLQCLDGKDRDNQSVDSDDDDDYGGESGEDDIDGNIAIPEDMLQKLDPEIREKYQNGEITNAELVDLLNEDGDFAELGEEGEYELNEEEGEAAVEEGDDAYGKEDEEQ